MKAYINLVVSIMFLFLAACDAEDDPSITYMTLINESQSSLRGLQGFLGSDPTIRTQNFENIPPGEEATIQFAMGCDLSWQLHVRLDGILFFYNYSDYTNTQVPCNQTTICTVHANESFSCNQ